MFSRFGIDRLLRGQRLDVRISRNPRGLDRPRSNFPSNFLRNFSLPRLGATFARSMSFLKPLTVE
jgi:hypothetical protein